MSRARERLIIVADVDRIHRRRPHKDSVGEFFKAALGECNYLNPLDLVGGRGLRQPELHLMRDDIDRAGSTIEIWSELVDEEQSALLVPHLAAAARRGCATTVWFHPAGDGQIPAGLSELRHSDVLLRPCTPIRESSAVIGDVVWASTDPILGRTGGTLLRLEHRDLADAVVRATRRRDSAGIAGSGQEAGRCGCGRLQIRDETVVPVRPACRRCDRRPDRHSGRSTGRRPGRA